MDEIKENLKKSSNKNTKIISHIGRAPDTLDIENKLIEFIDFNRKMELPINSWVIIIELIKLKSEYKSKKNKTLQMWLYRFLKGN